MSLSYLKAQVQFTEKFTSHLWFGGRRSPIDGEALMHCPCGTHNGVAPQITKSLNFLAQQIISKGCGGGAGLHTLKSSESGNGASDRPIEIIYRIHTL